MINSVPASTEYLPKNVITITGLPNVGDSCYLNASLQCLFQIPEIVRSIQTIEEKKDCLFLQSCKHIINDLKTDQKNLVSYLRDLSHAINISYFSNSPNQQQDAYEFLLRLIDTIPVFQSLFRFSWENKIVCEHCKHILKLARQSLNSLSLPILREETSLQNLINNYFKRTFIGSMPCTNCLGSNAKIYKKVRVNSYPPYCLIKCGHVEMQNKSIEFPITNLTFPEDNSPTYFLIGVIFYTGNSQQGHYISCVKQGDTNEWYLCDDNKVLNLTKFIPEGIELLGRQGKCSIFSPYIFVYAKKNKE